MTFPILASCLADLLLASIGLIASRNSPEPDNDGRWKNISLCTTSAGSSGESWPSDLATGHMAVVEIAMPQLSAAAVCALVWGAYQADSGPEEVAGETNSGRRRRG
ncbi:hypothetical protein IQ07DRAFT_601965 [Pyrenochaeta sp. DS3sAY3a]|nr:hypothetical protein IQ07DRAFT_601965 [Pyrenochaeta sp. DS3sAY3a]